MNVKFEQSKIKNALKHVMKTQGFTYADLANIWGCSLPTVKRQLGPEEMPLSRLLDALEWLNLSLSDLEKLAEANPLEQPRFTARQNEFLAKNPREFSFLMKLYEEKTPEQIAKQYGLAKVDVEKILIRLEKSDLIRVGRGGLVKPAYPVQPMMDGELALAHFREIIGRLALFHTRRVTDQIAKKSRGIKTADGGLDWAVREVSEKTYLEYLKKLRHLINDFEAVAKIESKSLKRSDLKIAAVSCGAFLCEPEDRDVQQLADIFGEALKN